MKRQSSTFGSFLKVAATVALVTAAVASDAPIALQPRTWDAPVTIPAGQYRASRAIDLLGEINAEVVPGVILDGIEFTCSRKQAHWKVTGAYLRNVKISGDLGTSMEARDSVFEKCLLSKGGAWFVSYWSTRWKFENCVFTRTFMNDSRLSATDYSVVARNCTFIGIRFPSYEIKGDGSYLRGPDLVLEHCKFIRCNFPRSFLAITKDCLFEGCTFSNNAVEWPRETVLQESVGYYPVGTNSAPASFTARPFAMKFAPAPEGFTAGSTLDFEESGGIVTLENFPHYDSFTPIGTLSGKKSSGSN